MPTTPSFSPPLCFLHHFPHPNPLFCSDCYHHPSSCWIYPINSVLRKKLWREILTCKLSQRPQITHTLSPTVLPHHIWVSLKAGTGTKVRVACGQELCAILILTLTSLWHKNTKRRGFPGGPMVKNLPCNTRDTGSILVQEDPTSLGTAKPVNYNYWAWALGPMIGKYWAHQATTTVLHNKRSTATRSPRLETGE